MTPNLAASTQEIPMQDMSRFLRENRWFVAMIVTTIGLFTALAVDAAKRKEQRALQTAQAKSVFVASCVSDRGVVKRYECEYLWAVMNRKPARKDDGPDIGIGINPATGQPIITVQP